MEKHSEIDPFARSILKGKLAAYDCAYLIQTRTSWTKSTLDSTEDFRVWGNKHQIIDYNDLQRGKTEGKTVDSFFFDTGTWLEASIKFYRSHDPDRSNKRISIQIEDGGESENTDTSSVFKSFVGIGDVLFFFTIRGYVYMFTLNQDSDHEIKLGDGRLRRLLNLSRK